jgi:hypothetical protein
MKIELFSFLSGVLIALAAMIVFEKVYGTIFGNRREKRLAKEVKHLKATIKKKDDFIKKSIQQLKKEDAKRLEEKWRESNKQ